MTARVCAADSMTAGPRRVPHLWESEQQFRLRLELIKPDVVKKSLSRVGCDGGEPLIEAYYEFPRDAALTSKNLELGIMRSLNLIGSRVYQSRLFACDPKFHEFINRIFLTGEVVDKEVTRTYRYRATADRLQLKYVDREACPTSTGEVVLTFSPTRIEKREDSPLVPRLSIEDQQLTP